MDSQKIKIVQPIYEESYSLQTLASRKDAFSQREEDMYAFCQSGVMKLNYMVDIKATNSGQVKTLYEGEISRGSGLAVGCKFNLGTPCEPKLVTLDHVYLETDGTKVFSTKERCIISCPTALAEIVQKKTILQAEEDAKIANHISRIRAEYFQRKHKREMEEALQNAKKQAQQVRSAPILSEKQLKRIARLEQKIQKIKGVPEKKFDF